MVLIIPGVQLNLKFLNLLFILKAQLSLNLPSSPDVRIILEDLIDPINLKFLNLLFNPKDLKRPILLNLPYSLVVLMILEARLNLEDLFYLKFLILLFNLKNLKHPLNLKYPFLLSDQVALYHP